MFDLQLLLDSVPPLAAAALVTAQVTIVAAMLSLVLGTLSAMLQMSAVTGGYGLSRAYVSAMRNTPLMVQLMVVFFGLGALGIKGQAFLAGALAIGLNSGAYTTEILRAAVMNVPKGHVEAAEAIGMSRLQIWRRVILPQAFFVSLPALTNEFTIVMKSTPLVAVVGVVDLAFAGRIIQTRTGHPLEIYLPMALFYLLIALVFTQLSRWLERRYALRHA